MATSADGTRIAWYRYGGGDRTILFVPTWNLVDARVVGHQVVALEPHGVDAEVHEHPDPVAHHHERVREDLEDRAGDRREDA